MHTVNNLNYFYSFSPAENWAGIKTVCKNNFSTFTSIIEKPLIGEYPKRVQLNLFGVFHEKK